MYMTQLNINMTPEFEALLKQYMEMNNIQHKSVAIRKAVEQAVNNPSDKKTAFHELMGAAQKAPLNPHPKFNSDDDIWEKT